MTRRTVHHVIAQAGRSAGISFAVHPHMLRHGTGLYLANQGHDTSAIRRSIKSANSALQAVAFSVRRFGAVNHHHNSAIYRQPVALSRSPGTCLGPFWSMPTAARIKCSAKCTPSII
jgi:hypothetical protein